MDTQTEPLSVEAVRALLVRAVEEKGADYVYTPPENAPDDEMITPGDCVYRDGDGSPSCIAGHVASYIGVLDELTEGMIVGAQEALHAPIAFDAIQGLDAAQSAQDRGKPWGEALAAFDATVARRSA